MPVSSISNKDRDQVLTVNTSPSEKKDFLSRISSIFQTISDLFDRINPFSKAPHSLEKLQIDNEWEDLFISVLNSTKNIIEESKQKLEKLEIEAAILLGEKHIVLNAIREQAEEAKSHLEKAEKVISSLELDFNEENIVVFRNELERFRSELKCYIEIEEKIKDIKEFWENEIKESKENIEVDTPEESQKIFEKIENIIQLVEQEKERDSLDLAKLMELSNKLKGLELENLKSSQEVDFASFKARVDSILTEIDSKIAIIQAKELVDSVESKINENKTVKELENLLTLLNNIDSKKIKSDELTNRVKKVSDEILLKVEILKFNKIEKMKLEIEKFETQYASSELNVSQLEELLKSITNLEQNEILKENSEIQKTHTNLKKKIEVRIKELNHAKKLSMDIVERSERLSAYERERISLQTTVMNPPMEGLVFKKITKEAELAKERYKTIQSLRAAESQEQQKAVEEWLQIGKSLFSSTQKARTVEDLCAELLGEGVESEKLSKALTPFIPTTRKG